MAKSRLQDRTELAVFIPEIAKQHDVLACRIACFWSAHDSFWLDKNILKLFECFHEDLPKTTLVPLTEDNDLDNREIKHHICFSRKQQKSNFIVNWELFSIFLMDLFNDWMRSKENWVQADVCRYNLSNNYTLARHIDSFHCTFQ